MGSVDFTPANCWPFNVLYIRGPRQGLLLATGEPFWSVHLGG